MSDRIRPFSRVLVVQGPHRGSVYVVNHLVPTPRGPGVEIILNDGLEMTYGFSMIQPATPNDPPAFLPDDGGLYEIFKLAKYRAGRAAEMHGVEIAEQSLEKIGITAVRETVTAAMVGRV